MSYDPTSTDDLDVARRELGDIGATELRDDAEYDALIAAYGLNEAIARLAASLAAEYARKPDRVTLSNGLSVAWSERVQSWLALAARYRGLVALSATATTGRACNRPVW